MNSFIKFHPQRAHLFAKEEPQTVEMPFGSGDPRVLKQVRARHIQRQLLQANKTMEQFVGQQSALTDDRCGSVLRQLRIQHGLDAFVVASKACMTVMQLYELETGKDSLFYTPGLRFKAAQRVAAILGSNWDDILSGRVIAKPQPGPTASLHLLKTPLMSAHFKSAHGTPASSSSDLKIEHQADAFTPVSCAVFLRVADTQD